MMRNQNAQKDLNITCHAKTDNQKPSSNWYLQCASAENYKYDNKRMQLQKVAIFETVNDTESFKYL